MDHARAPAGWPAGDGEMAERVRAHDWAATPLGAAETWPAGLRTVVELVLASSVASILVCGPARVLIYNDACIALYGTKHPGALGREGPSVFPELWPEIGPLYDRVFAGESLSFKAQPWAFERGAAPSRGLYDAFFTPGRDETGAVTFAQVTAIEVTAKARAEAALRESEERQAFLLKLSDALRSRSDPAEVQTVAMELLAERLRVMRASYYEIEEARDSFRLAARSGRDAVPVPERIELSDFSPALLEACVAGRTLAVADAAVEGEFVDDPQANAQLGVGAWAAVPLVREGRLVGWLGVHSATRREWSAIDLHVLENAAWRTRAAVERARTEEALGESESRFRTLAEVIEDVFYVTDVDAGRLDYLSPAFDDI